MALCFQDGVGLVGRNIEKLGNRCSRLLPVRSQGLRLARSLPSVRDARGGLAE
jgi:hypothetical protein